MANILVIDDTKNIRKMVKLALTQAGHTVEEAEDGVKGLERFGDGSAWDLTLLDQRMPAMEGMEVVREARQRDPAARLILMTAFASSELATQVLEIGAMDFLRKPFNTTTLNNAVETALAVERSTASTPAELSTSAAEIQLPQPGDPNFQIPRLSYRMNGFSFWPAPSSDLTKPTGMEFGRFFQIRKPDGSFDRCFIGITSHIREEVQRLSSQKLGDDNMLWDKLCGQALLNFIWEKAEMPPAVLPVYEIPTDLRSSHATQWMRQS